MPTVTWVNQSEVAIDDLGCIQSVTVNVLQTWNPSWQDDIQWGVGPGCGRLSFSRRSGSRESPECRYSVAGRDRQRGERVHNKKSGEERGHITNTFHFFFRVCECTCITYPFLFTSEFVSWRGCQEHSPCLGKKKCLTCATVWRCCAAWFHSTNSTLFQPRSSLTSTLFLEVSKAFTKSQIIYILPL